MASTRSYEAFHVSIRLQVQGGAGGLLVVRWRAEVGSSGEGCECVIAVSCLVTLESCSWKLCIGYTWCTKLEKASRWHDGSCGFRTV